jgi:hypothetical protein
VTAAAAAASVVVVAAVAAAAVVMEMHVAMALHLVRCCYCGAAFAGNLLCWS